MTNLQKASGRQNPTWLLAIGLPFEVFCEGKLAESAAMLHGGQSLQRRPALGGRGAGMARNPEASNQGAYAATHPWPLNHTPGKNGPEPQPV